MNVVIWIVTAVLATLFLFAGALKVSQPKDKLGARMAWVHDFSAGTIKFIGTAEILGAVGLILPAVTGIAPILVPLAATGLAITMVLAAIVHARRKEPQMIIGNAVLFAMASFVAIMRFGAYAF